VATGFDPEAEQEVDFARYGRMLARRWWLVAVGVVAGAVIGYLVSIGGTKLYSATATIYLGQPYNGTTAILTLQTNPSAVGAIANSESVDQEVAAACGEKTPKSFRSGISVQRVATNSPAKGLASQVSPLVTLTVQSSKGKVASCAANALAREAVARIGTYPEAKIKNYEKRVAIDTAAITLLNAKLADPSLAPDLLTYYSSRLTPVQQDLSTYNQLLLVAKYVELPKVTILARQREVSAQSHRSTVLIAALIGLILGIVGALLWDRIMARLTARNGS
jgi:capsular polysaccharide biosynthesis protein